MKKDIKRPLI
jgi:hypothetical protein